MKDDLKALTQSEHWLGWLGHDPGQAVRVSIEEMLQRQVPGSQLDWLRLTGKPEFLTGGQVNPDEPEKFLVSHVGLAVPFELQVSSKQHPTQELSGVFTWVARELNIERKDQTFLELGKTLQAATALLQDRLYGGKNPHPTKVLPKP